MTPEEKEVLRLYNECNGTSLDETDWIERLDWWWISAHQKLSEPFMERHAERLDWWWISAHQKLSEPFMERHAERLNWGWISARQVLSEPFMDRHAERLDWWSISHYQVLSEPFMDRHAERLDWFYISRHHRLSEPFIEKHVERLPENLRENNWLYADREAKIRHIREKAPEFSIQEDELGPFILAWKATRSGGRSDFDPSIVYAMGETREARCDCRMDENNSFGLSAWTEEGAKSFIPGGELYRVKIYIDDIGAMVHDGKKIRCRRQTFVERVK